jgi:hypothetical protein
MLVLEKTLFIWDRTILKLTPIVSATSREERPLLNRIATRHSAGVSPKRVRKISWAIGRVAFRFGRWVRFLRYFVSALRMVYGLSLTQIVESPLWFMITVSPIRILAQPP